MVHVSRYGSEYLGFSDRELERIDFGEDGYTVCCDATFGRGCGASIGWEATKEIAIKEWNNRA